MKDNNLIIRTNNLSKTYGNNSKNEVQALVDIDMEVRKGEFISIMGPSGGGKTTLMNMLGMLDRPTGGEVEIAGIDTTKVREQNLYRIRRENIGFIFQKFYLIPTLDALDNVLSPLLPVGIKKEDKKRAEELLTEVGLEDRVDHKPGELSGGQLQRVAVARALIMNPQIVLADEPTANLDSKNSHHILQTMKNLNKELNTTFIFATHDEKVMKYLDRKVSLEDGQIVKDETMTNSKN